MDKIHRKNQPWLYEKYKSGQDKEEKKIVIKNVDQVSDPGERSEKIYYLLDLAKLLIPAAMIVVAILLIF